MLLWAFTIILLQDPSPFLEHQLLSYRNEYEIFVDSENLSFEEMLLNEDAFLHQDSIESIPMFQHIWLKIYVPGLEDTTQYYLKDYSQFDEIEIHFSDGRSYSKRWNHSSDTSVLYPGYWHFPIKKSDLFDAEYFYAKVLTSYIRGNRLSFFTFNGKALWTVIHKTNLDRVVGYYGFNFAFAGAIVVILLYILATYFYRRDQVYLIYVAYLMSIGLYLFFRSQLVLDALFPLILPRFPSFEYHIVYTIQFLVHISYLWFTLTFLDAKRNYPLAYQSGKWASIFFLFCIIVVAFFIEFYPRNQFWVDLYLVERYVAIAYTILLQVYMIVNRKDKATLFIIIGSLFFIVGAAVSMIANDVYFFRAGTILEVLTFALGLAYRLRNVENEKANLEKEIERVKMIALRTQMKPHFLFNTINSIRALILKGSRDEAYENLAIFSKLIRYILESSESDLVSLNEELKMLKIYVEMEKLRLAEGFEFEYEVTEQVDAKRSLIPPLILQPFIENSIIHGLASKEGDKKVKLHIDRADNKLLCSIEDNGVGRKNAMVPKRDKKSMAIDLTKRRISLISTTESTEESVKIIDLKDTDGNAMGTKVDVSLPIILSA